MTNKEKYKDWLIENLEHLMGLGVLAVGKNGEPVLCARTRCKDCHFCGMECTILGHEWLRAEAEE